MKKILLIGLCCSWPLFANAQSCSTLLPQITMQLSAEDWVTTQTAKVTVVLDASLKKDQLATAQENFTASLNKIASDVKWHIIEFSRTGAKSNLEQVHAVAEARLSEKAVAGVRERAQAQSGEGQSYTIQDIVYSPSQEEMSALSAKLRAQIYDQAKEELTRLNMVYASPKFSIYSINFTNSLNQPGPNYMAKTMNTMAVPQSAPMTVSQQITQDALVIFAAPAVGCSEK